MHKTILTLLTLLAVAVVTGCGDGNASSEPAARVTYRVLSAPGVDTRPAIRQAATIMRARFRQTGAPGAVVSTAAGGRIVVELPSGEGPRNGQALSELGRTGRLGFYDWEPNVLGPRCKAAPTDPNVTGGGSAGTAGAGTLSHYDAVIRASKCPERNASSGDRFYLVDDRAKAVVDGPGERPSDVRAAKPGERVVRVPSGQLVVRAESLEPGPKADQWYVLRDRPALGRTEIENPQQAVDSGPGGTGQPMVTFDFTSKGRRAWQEVTRTIAHRGQARHLPGTPLQESVQHFAIVLDDELISAPFIDYQQNPDGIDATNGTQIEGGFTRASAARLAVLLRLGPLPSGVTLVFDPRASRLGPGK